MRALLVLAAAASVFCGRALAQPGYSVIRSFAASPDGYEPRSLLIGQDGLLYGVTLMGGSNSYGTVFKLSTDGATYKVIRNFGSGPSEMEPVALLQSGDGALYGAASRGSDGSVYGAVFKVSTNGSGYAAVKTFTYAAAAAEGGGPCGLVLGTNGVLYGIASGGGSNSCGTVFKLNQDGSGYGVIRYFTGTSGDGKTPTGLVLGNDGVLYGTTQYGGSNNGTVFRLNTDGSAYQVIKRFGSTSDGSWPFGLALGTNGTIYGTTYFGGSSAGTVFSLAADGTSYRTLKAFNGGSEGRNPSVSVIQGRDGSLYGTAYSGGASNWGTAFRVAPDGTNFLILRSFTGSGGDGKNPMVQFLQSPGGALFGGTDYGGGSGNGTIFTLLPPQATHLALSQQPASSATVGVPFGQQPVVALLDAGGNVDTNDSVTIVSASLDLGSSVLQGTTSIAAVGGLAVFTNLEYGVAETIRIRFTATLGSGQASVVSSDIIISPNPGVELAHTGWPMYQHDAQHTGRSPYSGPDWPVLKWTFRVDGVPGSPVLGEDGTIFLPSGMVTNDAAGFLYAIDPGGAQKWRYQFAGLPSSTTPAISGDGTIYVHMNGNEGSPAPEKLYAVRNDGTVKWAFLFNDGAATPTSSVVSSPAIAPDGTIYVGSMDGRLYAIRPNGALKWRLTAGGRLSASPAIAQDGTVYIADSNGNLQAIYPSGNLKWTRSGSGFASPSVAADGTIYATGGARLFGISSSGSQLWWNYVCGSPASQSAVAPSTAADGTCYAGDDCVHAFSSTGASLWQANYGGRVGTSAIVGSGGTLYWRQNMQYYALGVSGTKKWAVSVPGTTSPGHDPSAVLAADGSIYVPQADAVNSTNQYLRTYFAKVLQLSILQQPSSSATSGVVFARQPVVAVTDTNGVIYTNDSSTVIQVSVFTGNDVLRGTTSATMVNGIATFTNLFYDNAETIRLQFSGTIVSGAASVVSSNIVVWPNAGAVLANTAWPMFQHDLQHTGRSPYKGPRSPSPKWVFAVEGRPSSPVLGSDGTIFFAAGWPGLNLDTKGFLYAIGTNGSQKWRCQLAGLPGFTAPAIASDGTIYVHMNGNEGNTAAPEKLYAVRSDGTVKWVFTFNDGAANFVSPDQSSPAIGLDGTIYVGSMDTRFYAIRPDGTLRWRQQTAPHSSIKASPVIGPDGTVYILDVSSWLTAFTPAGIVLWQTATAGVTGYGSISLGADGTVYVPATYTNGFRGFSSQGTFKWAYTNLSGWMMSTPGIGSDGTIYVADDGLYAFRPDGTLVWKWGGGPATKYDDSPVLAADGVIYCNYYAVRPDGSTKWHLDSVPPVFVFADGKPSPCIGADGTLYVPMPTQNNADGQFLRAYYTAPVTTPPRITAVAKYGNDISVTWTVVEDGSYALQAFSGPILKSNSFNDISPVISITASNVSATNFLDLGTVTNTAQRYYRVRLVQ